MANTHYDVFNGDADGILALLQLRKAAPKSSIKITGVKRDIQLLQQVKTAESVTVLDISMEKNQQPLRTLLSQSVKVFYADHHRTGTIPDSPHLQTLIDTSATACTSLIVSKHLKKQYHSWAIAAAFGDNLDGVARAEAALLKLTEAQVSACKQLGVIVNYNGYGSTIEDLHYHPADLFEQLLKYDEPWDVLNDKASAIHHLTDAYKQDIKLAGSSTVLHDAPKCRMLLLNDAPWSRRISGVYANQLANQSPDTAHAIVTHNAHGQYTVSLRAPLNNKQYAGDICSQFATGGGRAAAAGINDIDPSGIDAVFAKMIETYS